MYVDKRKNVPESALQRYFQENSEKMGFSNVVGPFGHGPDFLGFYENRPAIIEIETKCDHYVLHGHPDNPGFKDVNILVVLDSHNPPEDIKDLLPSTIIHIDKDTFFEWYESHKMFYPQTASHKPSKPGSLILSEEDQNGLCEYTDMRNTCVYRCPEKATDQFIVYKSVLGHYCAEHARIVADLQVKEGELADQIEYLFALRGLGPFRLVEAELHETARNNPQPKRKYTVSQEKREWNRQLNELRAKVKGG